MNDKLNTFLEDEKLGKWLISDIWTKENYRVLEWYFLWKKEEICNVLSKKLETKYYIKKNFKDFIVQKFKWVSDCITINENKSEKIKWLRSVSTIIENLKKILEKYFYKVDIKTIELYDTLSSIEVTVKESEKWFYKKK